MHFLCIFGSKGVAGVLFNLRLAELLLSWKEDLSLNCAKFTLVSPVRYMGRELKILWRIEVELLCEITPFQTGTHTHTHTHTYGTSMGDMTNEVLRLKLIMHFVCIVDKRTCTVLGSPSIHICQFEK